MPLLKPANRPVAAALAELTYCNPFLPERIEYERVALGTDFREVATAWHFRNDDDVDSLNVDALVHRAGTLISSVSPKAWQAASVEEQQLYEDIALFYLYHQYRDRFDRIIRNGSNQAPFYVDFRRDFDAHLGLLSSSTQHASSDAEHLFACFFQVRRAFHYIFYFLVGGSQPMVALRAAAWQSIFTHNMRRYRRVLFERMGDFTTLITGPTGTGKELVARAIGRSRYLPFCSQSNTFASGDDFYSLNLSALAPTLVESELFGHSRGAFTGANHERCGWLETCGEHGTVFLDEIGELEPKLQVKLLRVLQTRTFQRLGETKERRFRGKIIAATNRDLNHEIENGRLRRDFYYRLCADNIQTPSLSVQIKAAPDELLNLVQYLCVHVVGSGEGNDLANDVMTWIRDNIAADYTWPGNVRELEQCVRNIVIRQMYAPVSDHAGGHDGLDRALIESGLSLDDLLNRYCTLIFNQTGNYVEAARRLAVDRRTIKSKVDEALLARLRDGTEPQL